MKKILITLCMVTIVSSAWAGFTDSERAYRMGRARKAVNTIDKVKEAAQASQIVAVVEQLVGNPQVAAAHREEYAALVTAGKQGDKGAARFKDWFMYQHWARLCDEVELLAIQEVVRGGNKVTEQQVQRIRRRITD